MAGLSLGVFSSGLSGKSGNTVFVQTPGGTLVRERNVPFDPKSANQIFARQRMTRASVAWSEMEPSNVEAWEDYAQSLAQRNPSTGQWRSPRPMNLFTAMYVKLLQLDIAALPPTSPPASAFFGDSVNVSVGSSSADPHHPAPSSSNSQGSLQEEGESLVTFTANRANSPGVVTELLLQPLANRNRKAYLDKYRSQAFVAFEDGSLTAEVPAEPGWYACAYRFVNTETGQDTALAQIGKVLVMGT